jgi:hypothetical protein
MNARDWTRAEMVMCLRAAAVAVAECDHAGACEWAWSCLSVRGADGDEFEQLSGAASRRLAESARLLAVARQEFDGATVYRVAGVFAGRAVVLDKSGRWAFATALGIEALTLTSWEDARRTLDALRRMESAAVGVVAVARSRREWAEWDEADERAAWYSAQIGQ